MDKSTYKLLKMILVQPELSFGIDSDKEEQLHYLERIKYIQIREETNLNQFREKTEKTRCYYSVTIAGRTFIESHKEVSFEKWFTRLLAIAAFIISILALLKP